MVHDRQSDGLTDGQTEIWSMMNRIFLSLWTIFLPFYPNNNLKNQNFEKMKKKLVEILSFYTSAPKIMIICYTVPEIGRVTDVTFIFHFGLFFALIPKKSKF